MIILLVTALLKYFTVQDGLEGWDSFSKLDCPKILGFGISCIWSMANFDSIPSSLLFLFPVLNQLQARKPGNQACQSYVCKVRVNWPCMKPRGSWCTSFCVWIFLSLSWLLRSLLVISGFSDTFPHGYRRNYLKFHSFHKCLLLSTWSESGTMLVLGTRESRTYTH